MNSAPHLPLWYTIVRVLYVICGLNRAALLQRHLLKPRLIYTVYFSKQASAFFV